MTWIFSPVFFCHCTFSPKEPLKEEQERDGRCSFRLPGTARSVSTAGVVPSTPCPSAAGTCRPLLPALLAPDTASPSRPQAPQEAVGPRSPRPRPTHQPLQNGGPSAWTQ